VHIRTNTKGAPATLLLLVACQVLPAAAQSLALTYELDVGRDGVERFAPGPYPCAGSRWLTFVEVCETSGESAAFAHASQTAAQPDSRRASVGGAIMATPTAVPRETFQADAAAPDPRLRPSEVGRAADVSLRVGAQARSRSFEDAAELSPLKSRTYEGALQNNAHKALGLELLLPFQ
jgi:hypothetical protein